MHWFCSSPASRAVDASDRGCPPPDGEGDAGGPLGSADPRLPVFSTDIVLSQLRLHRRGVHVRGTAHTYTAPTPDGTVEVAESGIPYRTRLIVRRPSRQARFNGVVLVEWFNVTNQYDTDVLWLYQKEFLIREGYAWVGVSAQNVGLSAARTGLKAWSPKRYGTLDVTNGGKITGDALAADIYSQAGAAVRRVPAVLGGLKPAYVIAGGQSQSAGRMGPYLNGHTIGAPIMRRGAADGEQRGDPSRSGSRDQGIERDRARQRAAAGRSGQGPRLAVAGATHSEQYSLLSRAAFLERDLHLPAVDAATPARSRVEFATSTTRPPTRSSPGSRPAAPPPHAPMFTDASAPSVTHAATRLGGIRTARSPSPWRRRPPSSAGSAAPVPFDAATINALYPTHADYVSKVQGVADLVLAGFLLPADAALTIDKAKRAIWGS